MAPKDHTLKISCFNRISFIHYDKFVLFTTNATNCMVIDGSYTCDEHRIMYRDGESLRRAPETKIVCQLYSNF